VNFPEEKMRWQGSPSPWMNFGAYFFGLLVATAVVAPYFWAQLEPLAFAGGQGTPAAFALVNPP
jgi:hypothetical protein